MKKIFSVRILAVLLVLFCVGGCNRPGNPVAQSPQTEQSPQSLQKAILGKWKKDGEDVMLEFTPDGRCVSSSSTGDPRMVGHGKYSFPAPGRVSLEAGKGGQITYSVQATDKTLKFAGNGPTESYTRVK